MIDDNQVDGKNCYENAAADTRAWFERQWRIWPERLHRDYTTNIRFHHGGILAFRVLNGCEPALSDSLRSAIRILEKHDAR